MSEPIDGLAALPDDVLAMLATERGRPDELAGDARLALYARVEARIGAPTPGGGSGSGGRATPRPPVAGAPRGTASTRLVRALGVRWFAVPTLLVGVVLGAALRGIVRPASSPSTLTRTRVVEVVREVPVALAPVRGSLPEADVARAIGTPEHVAVRTSPVGDRRPDPGADHDSALARERVMIDTARTALARGQDVAARRMLEQHAQQFPRGQFAEEREALLVQALVGAGDYTQARARGTRFVEQYPASMLRSSVESSLRSIP